MATSNADSTAHQRGVGSEKAPEILFYTISALFALACLFPFVLVIVASFTDEATLVRDGYQLFPAKLSLDAYLAIFSSSTIPTAYMVSTFITVAGTALSLLITAMAAYAISGERLQYRNIIAFAFYFTMLFSGGLVPTYILISRFLQLRNNIWVYILPNLVNPWNMFLLRNFFNEIPTPLLESARIEGASEIRILFAVVLPLSLPALATISLFYALAYWNIWMESMLYVDRERLHTLQYIIMKIMRNIEAAKSIAVEGAHTGYAVPPSYTSRLATSLVTIGPIILLYPFLQKYFVTGLKVGGVKG